MRAIPHFANVKQERGHFVELLFHSVKLPAKQEEQEKSERHDPGKILSNELFHPASISGLQTLLN